MKPYESINGDIRFKANDKFYVAWGYDCENCNQQCITNIAEVSQEYYNECKLQDLKCPVGTKLDSDGGACEKTGEALCSKC